MEMLATFFFLRNLHRKSFNISSFSLDLILIILKKRIHISGKESTGLKNLAIHYKMIVSKYLRELT